MRFNSGCSKTSMRDCEELELMRTFLYAAITRDDDNKADGAFWAA